MSLKNSTGKNVRLERKIETVGGTIYPLGTEFTVKEYTLSDEEEKIVLTPRVERRVAYGKI